MASGTSSSERVKEWVVEHGDALHRYALSMVRDPATAEDLVQDAFLAALKAAPKFRGRSNPRTWLTGILRHKIVDYFRTKAKEASYTATDVLELDAELFDAQGRWVDPPSNWPLDPHQSLAGRQFRQTLNQCLARLDQAKRAVIMLRAFEGLSSEEVCKELAITPTNLWVLAHRARENLRRCLDKYWFGDKES